jgi:hypothetical protein
MELYGYSWEGSHFSCSLCACAKYSKHSLHHFCTHPQVAALELPAGASRQLSLQSYCPGPSQACHLLIASFATKAAASVVRAVVPATDRWEAKVELRAVQKAQAAAQVDAKAQQGTVVAASWAAEAMSAAGAQKGTAAAELLL